MFDEFDSSVIGEGLPKWLLAMPAGTRAHRQVRACVCTRVRVSMRMQRVPRHALHVDNCADVCTGMRAGMQESTLRHGPG